MMVSVDDIVLPLIASGKTQMNQDGVLLWALSGTAIRNGIVGRLQHEIGGRIPFSQTVRAFNAIIGLSSYGDSYPAFSPPCMSEDKTQELEIYSGSYPVGHNDAAGSMLCNKCGIGRQPTCFLL
jgi:hypothetical protein